MLPGAVDTIKYVVKITLNGNKGPFFSQATVTGKRPNNTVLTAKSSDGANVNATPSRTVLRFDLPNTRIGLAKEVVTTALKNDSTTYWTVPYRIIVVNMGANAITKLSVKDNLDSVFTVKGATIIGKPDILPTPGLTFNPDYTGKGTNTELLIPDKSTLAKGDTAEIRLTVRVNVAGASDPDKIFNNVALGTATGIDNAIYTDVSTNGNNPDKNGNKDPKDDNEATPVSLKSVNPGVPSIGIALAAVSDTIPLADSTCNVTLIMTVRNYAGVDLKKIRLCNNLEKTIGTSVESWKLIGLPRVIKGNVKINPLFNGKTDSTLVKADSSFLAKADTIQIAYMINIKRPVNDTIYTQAIAKGVSTADSTKIFSDISVNGINPDVNGNGKAEEESKTPIICPGVPLSTGGELIVAGGLSPNGDNVNDGLNIKGYDSNVEDLELIIFNRWGGVVYATKQYLNNSWKGEAKSDGDGSIKVIGSGQGLPDGTYFYCATRSKKDGTKVDLKPKVGYITLVR
jgi:large repetitive protein